MTVHHVEPARGDVLASRLFFDMCARARFPIQRRVGFVDDVREEMRLGMGRDEDDLHKDVPIRSIARPKIKRSKNPPRPTKPGRMARTMNAAKSLNLNWRLYGF